MEDSRLPGTVEPERLGVYFGSGVGGMTTFQAEVGKLREKGPKRVSPYFVPMMIANMAAAEIAILYQAEGPCLPVVTACATGSNSIGEAYRAILHGYADAMICGGAEAPILEIGVAGFTNMMALSQSDDANAASLPFDARRSGFVMSEGRLAWFWKSGSGQKPGAPTSMDCWLVMVLPVTLTTSQRRIRKPPVQRGQSGRR